MTTAHSEELSATMVDDGPIEKKHKNKHFHKFVGEHHLKPGIVQTLGRSTLCYACGKPESDPDHDGDTDPTDGTDVDTPPAGLIQASAYTTDKIHLPTASFGKVSPKTRARAAERGEAMEDGSFPIRDGADLRRAIAAYGRAKDKGAAKRHIMRRARALDKVDALPAAWKEAASQQFSHTGEKKPVESPVDAALREKADRHNARAADDKQVSLPKLRAVYKRGLAAAASEFSAILSPDQQAQARVNSFLRLLASGERLNPEYTQDDDLLPGPPPFSYGASDGALLARGAGIPWVEADHPRDRNGKWIDKGAHLKFRFPGEEWQVGQGVGFQGDTWWVKQADGSVVKVPRRDTLYTKAEARLPDVPAVPAVPAVQAPVPHVDDGSPDAPIPHEMRTATPEDRKRLKIPPAWTDVTVSSDPTTPLQAIGRDSKGRAQYRYTDEHRAKADEIKFARMKALHEVLPQLDAALAQDAGTDGTAAAVYMMRTMGIRNGSETDTGAKKFAYGASNMRAKHVLIDGENVTLSFDAKDNVHIVLPVTDSKLQGILRDRVAGKAPDAHLFGTNERKTNAYLKQHVGDEFKIKDLRTYFANSEALAIIAGMPKPQTAAEFAKARREVAAKVSALLGNTPTVALKSYINPTVFNVWLVNAPWITTATA